jgi:hypothetical protein
LTKLFCKEIYPNTSANTPSYSVSIDAPAINTTDANNGELVEVGAIINFGEVTTPKAKTSKTDPKVSGLIHGYWVEGEDGSWSINKNTSLTTGWIIEQKDDSKYKLTPTISGFTSDSLPTTVEGDSSIKLDECTLKASLGVNSYTVKVNSPIYTGSHPGIDKVYVVSNLGNKSDKMTPEIPEASGVEHDKTSATTFKVTGVYPVYSNRTGDNSLNSETAVNREDLSEGSTFEITYGKETDGTNKYVNMFAFPATHTLSKIEVYNDTFDAWSDFGGFDADNPEIGVTVVKYSVQGTEINYKVWKRPADGGSEYPGSSKFRFTIK